MGADQPVVSELITLKPHREEKHLRIVPPEDLGTIGSFSSTVSVGPQGSKSCFYELLSNIQKEIHLFPSKMEEKWSDYGNIRNIEAENDFDIFVVLI